MFGKPTKWEFLLKAFPFWRPVTDFWRKTTDWPVLGKYARWLHNEKHYDVTFIPINKELEEDASTVVPKQVVSEIIKKSCHRVIMKVCLCRVACGCEDHHMEWGCLFLGEATKDTDPSMARHASVEEALEHMDRCIESGLIPQIGRVDVDPLMLGVGNWDHFLTLCFCCPCCCVAMRDWQRWSPVVKDRMHGLEGLRIEVTDECNGCGKCVKKCFTEAIVVEDKLARITDDCKGCGICAEVCPKDAIEISVSDGDKLLHEAFKRIESYVDIVSESDSIQ
jgi:UDP-glucose 4-epimerase